MGADPACRVFASSLLIQRFNRFAVVKRHRGSLSMYCRLRIRATPPPFMRHEAEAAGEVIATGSEFYAEDC